jgi:hypothetical protein
MWATSFGLTLDHLQAPTSIQSSTNKTDKMCIQHYFKKQSVQDDILYWIPFFQVLEHLLSIQLYRLRCLYIILLYSDTQRDVLYQKNYRQVVYIPHLI